MTPDVYERDFHLPKGHATSFGGGPLAAFRNPNPELTKYETDVDGLFLTRVRQPFRVPRVLGRERPKLRNGRARGVNWTTATRAGERPGMPVADAGLTVVSAR